MLDFWSPVKGVKVIRNYAEDRAQRLVSQTGYSEMYDDYKAQYIGYGVMYFLCITIFIVAIALAVALDTHIASSALSLVACGIALFIGRIRRGEMRYISDALNGEIAPSTDAVTSP